MNLDPVQTGGVGTHSRSDEGVDDRLDLGFQERSWRLVVRKIQVDGARSHGLLARERAGRTDAPVNELKDGQSTVPAADLREALHARHVLVREAAQLSWKRLAVRLDVRRGADQRAEASLGPAFQPLQLQLAPGAVVAALRVRQRREPCTVLGFDAIVQNKFGRQCVVSHVLPPAVSVLKADENRDQ